MRVQDLMTKPVIGIAPSATIAEAARLMSVNRISGLPVVDEQSRLVGMITEGDFMRRAELGTEINRKRWLEFFASSGKLAGAYVETHGRKVDEVMSSPPVAISPSSLLGDAVDLMLRHHVRRLPVTEGSEVVGIISRSDLMRALVGQLPAEPAIVPSDEAIRTAVLEELSRHEWASKEMTRVDVKDGVVELEGMIFDERQRAAMKVAAENVPGVKAVSDHLVWIEPMSGMVVLSPSDRGPALTPGGGLIRKVAAPDAVRLHD